MNKLVILSRFYLKTSQTDGVHDQILVNKKTVLSKVFILSEFHWVRFSQSLHHH